MNVTDKLRSAARPAGYPTVDEVRKMPLRINPVYRIQVEHDTIFALPPNRVE